ncbi:MAG: carboxypeptidase regulatory-like domain-containing protein [Terriglobales bacterium]
MEIRGRVEDSQGNPVEGAMVELHAFTGGVLSTEVTNAVGEFEFKTNMRGPYQLEVTTASQRQVVSLDEGAMGLLVVQLPEDNTEPGSANPAGKGATVSLNDLEAGTKARSKLADAERALTKPDLAKAWKLVNEAILAAPNWGRAYLLRGVLSMSSRNYGPARSDLTKAVESDPTNGLALTEMGKLYATTGNYTLADQYFRRALTIPPVKWPTYFELAALDIKRGNYTEAEQMARSALASTPPAPPAAHFVEAEAADHLGDAATAAAEYRSFIALTDPATANQAALAAARHRILRLEKH